MTEDLTALQGEFVSGLGELKAPVIAIMGAGLGITVLIAGFNLFKQTFKKSTR